MLSWVY